MINGFSAYDSRVLLYSLFRLTIWLVKSLDLNFLCWFALGVYWTLFISGVLVSAKDESVPYESWRVCFLSELPRLFWQCICKSVSGWWHALLKMRCNEFMAMLHRNFLTNCSKWGQDFFFRVLGFINKLKYKMTNDITKNKSIGQYIFGTLSNKFKAKLWERVLSAKSNWQPTF